MPSSPNHPYDAMTIERDAAGRLVYVSPSGERHTGVAPVRAFPLSHPEQGVSIVDTKGHELLWVDDLSDLPESARHLILEELTAREFRPCVTRIVSVSTFATPSTWHVETDRGNTQFVLKAEEDIRRLDRSRLLISSGNGVCYEVTDRWALDRGSRRLLERFM